MARNDQTNRDEDTDLMRDISDKDNEELQRQLSEEGEDQGASQENLNY